MNDFKYCGRGPCSAEAGHGGSCEEASGWSGTEAYIPTTDEIETGFSEFASRLETESPGEYSQAPEFADWREAVKGFQRWHAEEIRRAKEQAWYEGKWAEETAWMHTFDGHPVGEGETCDECSTDNPYRR